MIKRRLQSSQAGKSTGVVKRLQCGQTPTGRAVREWCCVRGIGAVLVLKIGMNRCVKGVIGAFDCAGYIKEAKHFNEAIQYPLIKDDKEENDWLFD